jgi:hypothetical protein
LRLAHGGEEFSIRRIKKLQEATTTGGQRRLVHSEAKVVDVQMSNLSNRTISIDRDILDPSLHYAIDR